MVRNFQVSIYNITSNNKHFLLCFISIHQSSHHQNADPLSLARSTLYTLPRLFYRNTNDSRTQEERKRTRARGAGTVQKNIDRPTSIHHIAATSDPISSHLTASSFHSKRKSGINIKENDLELTTSNTRNRYSWRARKRREIPSCRRIAGWRRKRGKSTLGWCGDWSDGREDGRWGLDWRAYDC